MKFEQFKAMVANLCSEPTTPPSVKKEGSRNGMEASLRSHILSLKDDQRRQIIVGQVGKEMDLTFGQQNRTDA